MSKKQGRSRNLVRESDVADILSNWSDVLQNTRVCSLIYIYMYMRRFIPLNPSVVWVFISGCMTSVWTLRFNMFLTGKLGFAEGVKIGTAQTNDLLWWVPCFINVYSQGFIEQHSSLVFRTWYSPATLVFLWHPFLQRLKWNWLLQFDLEVAPLLLQMTAKSKDCLYFELGNRSTSGGCNESSLSKSKSSHWWGS